MIISGPGGRSDTGLYEWVVAPLVLLGCLALGCVLLHWLDKGGESAKPAKDAQLTIGHVGSGE